MDAKINGMIFKGTRINNLIMADYEFKLLEFTRPVTPVRNYEAVNIPNRDGSKYFINNFQDSEITVKLGIHGKSAVQKQTAISTLMANWITGQGRLIFLDRPNIFYNAYIFESIEQDLGDYWTELDITFNVSFASYQLYGDLRDFFASDPDELETVDAYVNTSSFANITATYNGSVTNEGNYKALPVIYFFGSADLINLTMGDTAFSFADLNGFVYIDCDNMVVYTIQNNQKVSLLTNFSGNFPQVNVGLNNFRISGNSLNLTEVRIEFPSTFIA